MRKMHVSCTYDVRKLHIRCTYNARMVYACCTQDIRRKVRTMYLKDVRKGGVQSVKYEVIMK